MRLKQRDQGEIRIRAENSPFGRRVILKFRDFISIRETEGWPLLVAAIVALILANSGWSTTYDAFWQSEVKIEIGRLEFHETLHHLVNDLLLPLFFFILGLDLKYELVAGELSSWKSAAMPLFIGAGGMLMPVGFYLLVNSGTPYMHGWGIPIATDVAFTLAVLMMLGKRIPRELKILTIAFAAVDDIGGVVAIAVFYTGTLSLAYLAATLVLFGIIAVMRFIGARTIVLYTIFVLAFLFTMYHSGVHTTIAGVALGLLAPGRPLFDRKDFLSRQEKLTSRIGELRDEIHTLEKRENTARELVRIEELRNEEEGILGQLGSLVQGTESGVERLLRSFNPWVTYIVLPLFALANAGIHLDFSILEKTLYNPGARGIMLGLVLGKPLGISLFAFLAQKLGIAKLPAGIAWHHLLGMALLAGMGFTVSIFIANLAFTQPDALLPAKTAVLLASLCSGLIGYIFLHFTCTAED